MFLDLNQRDQAVALQPQPNEGHDLPATFGETFDAAWSQGQLFGQSIAHNNARDAAVEDYIAGLNKRSGTNFDALMPDGGLDMDGLKAHVEKLRAERPDLNLDPLTDDAIEQMAVEKSRAAQSAYEQMARREKTFGGQVGMLAGGAASAATDPINLLALPLAPEAGVGILASALRFGAITAGSQTAIEIAAAPFHEEVQPGYGQSGQPLANIVEAGVSGAALGGVTKTLGNLWTRAKTGAWPTSVRDAGNVLESEANIAQTNAFPGLEGEVAHRTALAKTIDDVIAGRPADVESVITPEMRQSLEDRFAPLMAERLKAKAAMNEAEAVKPTEAAPELPFDQTAAMAAALGHVETMADHVQDIARAAGYIMPRDEATTVAARMAKAPDEQVASDLDTLLQRPSAAAEAETARTTKAEPQTVPLPPGARLAGKGLHGPILENVGSVGDAVAWLRQSKTGDIRAVLAHPAIGDRRVDLIYGDAKHGVAHIDADHPRHLDHIESIWDQLPIKEETPGRIVLENELGRAVIAKDFKGDPKNWLLTYFEKKDRPGDVTVASAPDKGSAQQSPSRSAGENIAQDEGLRNAAAENLTPQAMEKTLGSPDHTDAMLNDLDKLRVTGDRQIPAGVDQNGEPVMRSLDEMVEDVKADRDAATELEGCITPPQAEATE